MEEQATPTALETEADLVFEHIPAYLSVGEAARSLGVSERTIYGYIKERRLTGARVGNLIVVKTAEVDACQRRPPGRQRVLTPRWHRAPIGNRLYFTTITVQVRPGQDEELEQSLTRIRTAREHVFPGTSARYVVRDQHQRDDIQIVLVWRSVAMPSAEQREAALAALATELAGVLDWDAARIKEGEVLLHA